jgi:hypothetical protein
MSLQNAHISTVWAFKASLSACQLFVPGRPLIAVAQTPEQELQGEAEALED